MKATTAVSTRLALCAAILSSAALAIEVQLGETGSALISPRSEAVFLANMGADTNYTAWFSINRNGSRATDNRYDPKEVRGFSAAGIILWYFNLGAQSGKVATANAQVSCNVMWGWSASETYRIYQILSNWDETTVTWENWMGAGTTNFGNRAFTNWFGPELDYDIVAGTMLSTWTITSTVVQTWLNDPVQFKGLAIVPVADGARFFWSREATWRPASDLPLMVLQVQSANTPPVTPTNQTPVNGSSQQPLTPTLVASAFSDPNGDGHGASQWQVAADAGFSSIAFDSGATNATTSVPVPAGRLAYATRYYWRVRYRDNNGTAPEWSPWSQPTLFSTMVNVGAAVVKDAVQSAMVLLRLPLSNQNMRTMPLFMTDNSNAIPNSIIMHQFDLSALSSYTGLQVSADADLSAILTWFWEANPPGFKAYRLLAPWDMTTVTWSNYFGMDPQAFTNMLGPELDFLGITTVGTQHWSSIDADLVQDWIRMPASNFGLALVPNNASPAQFWSQPTRLTFDVINTNAPAPNTPTNVSPANGATGQALTPTLQCTAYSGSGTPQGSQWQVSEDTVFAAPAWDSGLQTAVFTSVSVPSGALSYSARYYWRVRHTNTEGGKSAWSAPTSFDTILQPGQVVRRANKMAMIKCTDPVSNWNGTVDSFWYPFHIDSNDGRRVVVLCSFDLSLFASNIVGGDAQLRVNWGWVDVNFGDLYFSCYRALAPWDETGVTWNTYVGLNDTNYGARFGAWFGQTLPVGNESSTIWTIAQTTIQDWIDNGVSNFGVAIHPEVDIPNAQMYTRKAGSKGPTLTFDILPEPACFLLPAALALWSRRRTALASPKRTS